MNSRIRSNQRTTPPLTLFLATFISMFLVGMVLFQSTESIPASKPIFVPQSGNTVKVFLVMVDDLSATDPQLDSLWALSINSKLANINFLEMTNNENWDTLLNTFSLSNDFTLSNQFLQVAQSTVEDAQGYILLDRYGAATILSAWLPEKNSIASPQKVTSQQIAALCGVLDGSAKPEPVQLGQLSADNHLIVDPEIQTSILIWEVFLYPQTQRSCLAVANTIK